MNRQCPRPRSLYCRIACPAASTQAAAANNARALTQSDGCLTAITRSAMKRDARSVYPSGRESGPGSRTLAANGNASNTAISEATRAMAAQGGRRPGRE
jgi:hypothetical protein